MPIKCATGRESRVKHSTASDPDQVEKARRRHPRPRYSTGESASIAHVTGRETDYRALEGEAKPAAATPRAK